MLVLTACTSQSAGPATTPSPASPSSAVPSTESPSPSAPSPFPASLPNGWEYAPDGEQLVHDLVNSLNQVSPDADLDGAVYRSSDDFSLIVMIGDGKVDPIVLDAFVDGHQERVREYTTCAADKGRVVCLTDTSPSVLMYEPEPDAGDENQFTVDSLAELAAEVQADL